MIERKSKSINKNPKNSLIKTKGVLSGVLNNGLNTHLKWAVFGDSMAGAKTQYIFPHLSNVMGQSGAFGAGNYNGATYNNQIKFSTDYNLYPFEMPTLKPNEFLIYGFSGVNATADIWKIFYIKNGSSFNVSIDTVVVETVVTNNDNSIGVLTLSTTLNPHSIKITCLSGNLLLPILGMYNSQISGIIPIYTNQGGNDMSNWITNIKSLENLMFVYSELDINVFSYEMKENTEGFENRLVKLLDSLNLKVPNAEILLFCSTPIINDVYNSQDIQRKTIKKQAEFRDLDVFDCYEKIGSYENLLRNNWQGDGVHPSNECQKFLTNEFLTDFNLLHFVSDDSPVSFFQSVKASVFESLNEVFEFSADPVYKLDAYIKTKRLLSFKNFNNTREIVFDLGDGKNGSDGSASILPFRFRLGNNNAIIQGDQNGVTIKNGTQGGNSNLIVDELYTKTFGTAGFDFRWVNGAGGIIGKIFNSGNFVFNTEGIADNDIPCAKVTIESTTQGFLIPRMSTNNVLGIINPVHGLIVYNHDIHAICVFNGQTWQRLLTSNM